MSVLFAFNLVVTFVAVGFVVLYRRTRAERAKARADVRWWQLEASNLVGKLADANAATIVARNRLQAVEAELKSTDVELNQAHAYNAKLREELDGAERVARDAEAQLSQFTDDLRTLLNRFTETTKSAGG